MTHRVYARWPDQRVSDKTTTEDPEVADLAYRRLLERADLRAAGAHVAWTIDGKQHRYTPFPFDSA